MIYIDKRTEEEFNDEFISFIENTIDRALEEEKIDFEYEVSVVLTNNEDIKNINAETRGINNPTDVLSFPMIDYPHKKVFKDVYLDHQFEDSYFDEDALVLGDIVVSVEKCREQAEEYGHSFEREIAYLLVHSVLHLLGYDHMEEDDKKIMREREEEVLLKLNITRD